MVPSIFDIRYLIYGTAALWDSMVADFVKLTVTSITAVDDRYVALCCKYKRAKPKVVFFIPHCVGCHQSYTFLCHPRQAQQKISTQTKIRDIRWTDCVAMCNPFSTCPPFLFLTWPDSFHFQSQPGVIVHAGSDQRVWRWQYRLTSHVCQSIKALRRGARVRTMHNPRPIAAQ